MKAESYSYTYILDWNGGTFVSQNTAESLSLSLKNWAYNLDFLTIEASNQSKEIFLAEVMNESITPIDGVKNVWCISPLIQDEIAIVHIVQNAD